MPTLLLLCLLTASPAPQAPARQAPAQEPPAHNIVVIVADDLGVDLVGAYEGLYAGHPDPASPNRTPALDYLAETGVLFRNAWTSPLCGPTRAQILTGKHARATGLCRNIDRRRGLALTEATIPSMLRDAEPARYHTAAVGKWHLAGGNQHPPAEGEPVHPLGSRTNPWFHQYAGSMRNLSTDRGGYVAWLKTYGSPIDPTSDPCSATEAGFCEVTVESYATVDTARDAIHLVRTMPEPFFLYVPFNAPHLPYDLPETKPPPVKCLEGRISTHAGSATDASTQAMARSMVTTLDNEIGRLICAIEDGPDAPAGPTTIVFLGDNGSHATAIVAPFLPERGKASIYEGGIHVPFLVKSPRIPAKLVGRHSDALVCSTDLFATVAELAGVTPAPDPRRESVSLVPLLTGSRDSVREHVYAEMISRSFKPTAEGTPPPRFSPPRHRQAIRDTDGYKLIRIAIRDAAGDVEVTEELYDVKKDPHERVDLLASARAGAEPAAAHYEKLRGLLDTRYPNFVGP